LARRKVSFGREPQGEGKRHVPRAIAKGVESVTPELAVTDPDAICQLLIAIRFT